MCTARRWPRRERPAPPGLRTAPGRWHRGLCPALHQPARHLDPRPPLALYNDRATIEAFFCASRHVYNIQNLRSRKFYAFLRFVVLTHNLLVWTKHARLARPDLAPAQAQGHAGVAAADTDSATEFDLATATTRQLVSYAARVRAQVHWAWDDGRWHVRILRPRARSSRWAALLIATLIPPPQPVQLALPFARLHKT